MIHHPHVCVCAFYLAHFNQTKELVHLLVEAGGPDLSLQHQTKAAASPFVHKRLNGAQCSAVLVGLQVCLAGHATYTGVQFVY